MPIITLAKTEVSEVVDGGVLGEIRVGDVGLEEDVECGFVVVMVGNNVG